MNRMINRGSFPKCVNSMRNFFLRTELRRVSHLESKINLGSM